MRIFIRVVKKIETEENKSDLCSNARHNMMFQFREDLLYYHYKC